MVEYLLFPAAFVLLLALLAAQFLIGGFTYGPRTRHTLWLLTAPAATGYAALALALPWRPLPRLVVGLVAGAILYLAMALVAVLHSRERKLAAVVGDVAALRRKVVECQRESDRLFWQWQGGGRVVAFRPAARRTADVPALRDWQRAGGPREERLRATRLSEWREEFRHSAPEDLAARARVLEAARLDVPEGERAWLDARLAVLWTVYRECSTGQREEADVRHQWEGVRRETARLQEQLAELQRQRATLRRQRLSLD